ncbi:HTH_Tnp_Tc3_2 domain-containing protein [Trichonephila clavipes]|nr:HTH_Tnp_Tc3_2 domain-containing protein [Trichonephila clavipes]
MVQVDIYGNELANNIARNSPQLSNSITLTDADEIARHPLPSSSEALHSRAYGTRNRGIPILRWMDSPEKDLKTKRQKLETMKLANECSTHGPFNFRNRQTARIIKVDSVKKGRYMKRIYGWGGQNASDRANCKGQFVLTVRGERLLRLIVSSQRSQTLAQITTQLNDGASCSQ